MNKKFKLGKVLVPCNHLGLIIRQDSKGRGVCIYKGKKLYDKRETIKNRDQKRDLDRQIKE